MAPSNETAEVKKLRIEAELLQRLAAEKQAEYEAKKAETMQMQAMQTAAPSSSTPSTGGVGAGQAAAGDGGKITISYDEDGRSREIE